jgi:hypothetical protein
MDHAYFGVVRETIHIYIHSIYVILYAFMSTLEVLLDAATHYEEGT